MKVRVNTVGPNRPSAEQCRWRPAALGVTIALLVASSTILAACGTTSSAVSIGPTCQKIGAILSDGPDPSADPVGYAEAQVAPLRAVKSTNSNLQDAVSNLATAYEQFFTTDGNHESASVLTSAENSLNQLCPGVAS
jgi:hypothetical protein